MSTSPTPDEPRHDEMLRAALRHAPDHDARPPDALSAQILHAAQKAAARSAPHAVAASPWAQATQAVAGWLRALTRPAPAAAFASLMLATVIGVMWREGPPPESRGRLEAAKPLVAETAASKSAADRSGSMQVAVQNPAPSNPAASAGARQAPRTGAAEAAASPTRRSTIPPRPATETTPAVPPTSGPAEGQVAAASAEVQAPTRTSPTHADASAPAAAAAPVRRAEDETRRAAEPSSPTVSETVATRERRSTAPSAMAERAETARAGNEPAGQVRNALATMAPADPLELLADGWAGASDTQRTALDELRRLSAGRWIRARLADSVPSAELRRADGQPLGRLSITDDAVLWRQHGGDGLAWRAPLDPAVAAELRRRLALPG